MALQITVGKTEKLLLSDGSSPVSTSTFVSQNPGIATVDGSGHVTGIAPGHVTIVVTNTADGTQAKATLTVVAVSPPSHAYILTLNPVGPYQFVSQSLIAGDGTRGEQDGSGTGAKFNEPWGLAVDLTHELLYVSDYQSATLRLVGSPDAVSTLSVATNSVQMGLCFGPDGKVYSAAEGFNEVFVYTPASFGGRRFGAGGPSGNTVASFAAITAPSSICYSALDDCFFVSSYNQGALAAGDGNIYKVDRDGNVTTYANILGVLGASNQGMGQIACNSAGDLYVTVDGGDKILKIAHSNQAITVGVDGSTGAVTFNIGGTQALTFDANDNLYVASAANIISIDTDGNRAVMCSMEKPDTTSLGGWTQIAFDWNNNLVMATNGGYIYRVNLQPAA